MKTSTILLSLTAVAASAVAVAGEFDRPSGFTIGERLTLRPYVSMSYTYDSNVDSTKHGKSGSQWVVNPGLGADYIAENWKIEGATWYQYHAYNRYSSQLNQSSYGERLSFNWANSLPNERGWTVKISEKFQQIAQDDDMSNHNGRGVGRDRKEFNAEGLAEYRMNEYVHAAFESSYYLLDYDNNVHKYAPLYGWKRATAGGEIGYAASKWTDFILAGNYQWFWQDNSKNRGSVYHSDAPKGRKIKSESRGCSIMGGIATRATERIDYRLLAGWSCFDFGNSKKVDGMVYQASARWKIHDRLSFMMLGSSYYQPSEYEYGSAMKIYTASAGFAHSFVRGRVTGNLDFAYRMEEHEYVEYRSDDYDNQYWTGRVGLNYHLNRYLTLFGRVEYQFNDSERKSYEYDRWRGTVGVRLSY